MEEKIEEKNKWTERDSLRMSYLSIILFFIFLMAVALVAWDMGKWESRAKIEVGRSLIQLETNE